ncbi:hypothetical protein Leryth_022338 [Lithospermum erythrorhizon]|uniref:Homeodomain transcription factor n=1 Tax=Lithospermum erythrorhizon TaxID=34254 RepID=A0AAV3PTP0_LITER|nr:hypothetical protein Leryth_022338 [Lithospermum erythrorhizon]
MCNHDVEVTLVEMEQRLEMAAKVGDIDALYKLLEEDPELLEKESKKPFTNTPLHIAASTGNTHLAVEVLNLKPSFGNMLNSSGLSPLHLALLNGHTNTARRIVKYNPELVRVKGRERVTPFHYVAGRDDLDNDLLAWFLLECPVSIEDLTVQGETALHVAVRNGNLRGLKVMLGWLQRTNKEDLLNWENENGNTVLHIAAERNFPEVAKLFIGKLDINAKNSAGFTALDIALKHPSRINGEIRNILLNAGASKALSLTKITPNISDILCRKETLREKWIRLNHFFDVGLSSDTRNSLLVVSVLIATATYQVILQPPGGILSATASSSGGQSDDAGTTLMSAKQFIIFIALNSICFVGSLGMIFQLIPGGHYNSLIRLSILFLLISYAWAAWFIAPQEVNNLLFFASMTPSVLVLIATIGSKRFSEVRTKAAARQLVGCSTYCTEIYTALLVERYSS